MSVSTRDLVVWPDGDAVTGVHEPLAVVAAHDGCASCLAVDGDTVATAGFDGFVRVWALNIASPTPQLRMTRLVRHSAARTPHRATARRGTCIKAHLLFWHCPCASQMAGHNGDVYALCARGTTVVSGGLDGTVRVWNAVTGRCEKILTGHKVRAVRNKCGG